MVIARHIADHQVVGRACLIAAVLLIPTAYGLAAPPSYVTAFRGRVAEVRTGLENARSQVRARRESWHEPGENPVKAGEPTVPVPAGDSNFPGLQRFRETFAANARAGEFPPMIAPAIIPALQPLPAGIPTNQHRSGPIDSALVNAVIRAESAYDPLAVSSKGAMGLMQLMPETARMLGVENPFHPEENIRGGSEYLGYLLNRYGGSIPLALAAYNAGPGVVDEYNGIPPYTETQNYVSQVLEYYLGPNSQSRTQPKYGRE